MKKASLCLSVFLVMFCRMADAQQIMTADECIEKIESFEGNVSEEVKEHWLHRLNKSNSMNRDITFYGKVVDPNGAGIPGAEISFRVDYLECWIAMGQEGKHITREVTSGSDGTFAISGFQGIRLRIFSISHEDFKIAAGKSFVYGRVMDRGAEIHEPDPDKPVLFVGHPIED